MKEEKFKEWGKLGGRPPKTENLRNTKVYLRVSENEKQQIQKIAKAHNLPVSDFLRNLSLNYELPYFSEDENKEVETLIEYKKHFSRISNLIKDKEGYREINKQVIEVSQLIKQYVYDRYRTNNTGQSKGD